MASPIIPFIEAFQLASGALTEGTSALSEAGLGEGDEARQGKAYAGQVIAEAFTQIKAAARRYMQTPEYLNRVGTQIILSDPTFQAAVLECVGKLDAIKPFIGVAGERIGAGLRSWVNDKERGQAAVIAMSCDAANKIAKTISARAA